VLGVVDAYPSEEATGGSKGILDRVFSSFASQFHLHRSRGCVYRPSRAVNSCTRVPRSIFVPSRTERTGGPLFASRMKGRLEGLERGGTARCVIMPYRADLINPCARARALRKGREWNALVAEGATRGKPSGPESIRGEPPHQYSWPRRAICSRSPTPSLLGGGGDGRAENRRPAPTRLMVIKRERRALQRSLSTLSEVRSLANGERLYKG